MHYLPYRQYGKAQKQLNDIVFEDISANTVSLDAPKPKKVVEKPVAQSIENNFSTSYYISTELLLLKKDRKARKTN